MAENLTETLFSLKGEVALVTGASRGLGWSMAQALAEAGAHVILNGRYAETLQDKCDRLAERDLSASVAAFDVSDEAAVSAAMARIGRERGRLDILVNNAGIVSRNDLLNSNTEDWRQVVDVNLNSLFVLSREAARIMIPQGAGRIISTGSVLSVMGRAGIPSYVATKHGVAGLTKSLAAELGPKGINVNAICPGYFRTDINQALQDDPDFSKMVEDSTPLGRWGKPEELAGAVIFLASKGGAYVNGHLLVVDGGMTTTL